MSVGRYFEIIQILFKSTKKLIGASYLFAVIISSIHLMINYVGIDYYINLKFAYINLQVLFPVIFSVPIIVVAYLLVCKEGCVQHYIGSKCKIGYFILTYVICQVFLLSIVVLFAIIFKLHAIMMYIKAMSIDMLIMSEIYMSIYVSKHIEIPIFTLVIYAISGTVMAENNIGLLSTEVEMGTELIGKVIIYGFVSIIMFCIGIIANVRYKDG